MNIWGLNIFQKIYYILHNPKNGGSKHDFLVLLNVLVGVHERVKNLLTRIGIRDSSLLIEYFNNFKFYEILYF